MCEHGFIGACAVCDGSGQMPGCDLCGAPNIGQCTCDEPDFERLYELNQDYKAFMRDGDSDRDPS